MRYLTFIAIRIDSTDDMVRILSTASIPNQTLEKEPCKSISKVLVSEDIYRKLMDITDPIDQLEIEDLKFVGIEHFIGRIYPDGKPEGIATGRI